jgi:polar amino acid transport system substrate-binding protein
MVRAALAGILLSIVGITILPAKADDVLPLATGEWPPYTSEQLPENGFLTELMAIIVGEMGMKPEFFFLPWPRATIITKQGGVFGAFPYAITVERQKDFYFSEVIHSDTAYMFYHKTRFADKPVFKTVEELRQFNVAALRGDNISRYLKENQVNLQELTTPEQLLLMLQKDRVDMVAIEKKVGLSTIKHLFPEQLREFVMLDKPLLSTGSSLMVSKQYPNALTLLKQFNEALLKIQQNGTYERVLAKHGFLESIENK